MTKRTPSCPPVQPLTRKTPVANLFDLLASVRFAVAVVIVIAIVCAVATFLPQGTEVAAYLQKNPTAAVRMEWLARLGLTHVFFSSWFIAFLCVLASSVAVCSTRRFATMRRTSGFAQRRALGSMFIHISILLILAGGVIRGVWGEKGYLALREGESTAQFEIENGIHKLPFTVALTNFEIETDQPPVATVPHATSRPAVDLGGELVVEWPERKLTARVPMRLNVENTLSPPDEPATPDNTFRITVLKYIPDFASDPTTREVTSRSAAPNNPAILVAVNGPDYQNHAWVFGRFPDFTLHTQGDNKPSPLRLVYSHPAAATPRPPSGAVKNFKSTLNLIEDGNIAHTRTVAVNQPLKFKGYSFYQTGYNPQDLSWSSFQVVRDPGVPVVYAGFGFLIGGLFIVFYLNPWIEARRTA